MINLGCMRVQNTVKLSKCSQTFGLILNHVTRYSNRFAWEVLFDVFLMHRSLYLILSAFKMQKHYDAKT